MKRSEINLAIEHAKSLFQKHQFLLPPFAYYSKADWQQTDLRDSAEIIENRLGWDITDFAQNQFHQLGLTLFTIRNGSPLKPHGKPYAEKIMVSKEEQVTPMHYHWVKIEDIINRGGGNLIIQLYWRDRITDELDMVSPVSVSVDGRLVRINAGEHIRLTPGESICLPPYLYHSFWGEKGKGDVIAGEVSSINDDLNDNRFLKPLGRFSEIVEDVPCNHLLCSDYDSHLQAAI